MLGPQLRGSSLDGAPSRWWCGTYAPTEREAAAAVATVEARSLRNPNRAHSCRSCARHLHRRKCHPKQMCRCCDTPSRGMAVEWRDLPRVRGTLTRGLGLLCAAWRGEGRGGDRVSPCVRNVALVQGNFDVPSEEDEWWAALSPASAPGTSRADLPRATPRRHGNGGVARCWSGSPDDQKACLGDFIIQGSHPDGAPRPSPLHTAPGSNMCPLD